MPTPEYHALLSPSSAKRWLHCPASVGMSKDIPAKTSEYAEAGRLAHSIAELKARKRFQPMAKRTYTTRLKKLQSEPEYHPEMDGYTDTYLEVLEQHAMTFSAPPFFAPENSVPIGAYTGEAKPDGTLATGTADCIQIAEGILWITDYKNGSGVPVDADHNPQMMLYALGALQLFAPIYGDTIQTVRMTIVQPALKSVADFEISRAELEAWGEEVKLIAAKAVSEDPGEPNPGDWCKNAFCPCRYTCPARRDKVLAVEAFGRKLPPLISNDEIGQALIQGEGLVAWYNELKDYALQECLAGRAVPGWKAVEGRGSRAWADTDAAIAQLISDGVDEAVLYERKPITAPAAEKLLGRAVYDDLCAELVVKKLGKPALAQESDNRPAYNAAASAFGKAGNA